MSAVIKEGRASSRAYSDGSRRRPRILHLINNFEIGGTERQAVELMKRLDTCRFDIQLSAVRNVGPLYSEVAARFPNIPEFPLTSFYNTNAVRQFVRLRSLLVQENIDILHAHDFYAGVLGVAAAQRTGVRIIASRRHLHLSDRRVHEWGELFIARWAHRLVVNSEAIRSLILNTSSVPISKIVLIHNGLSVPQRPPDAPGLHNELCRELGLPANARLVGMVAKLREEKGHRFFVEAAARIVQSMENVHFVLVGDGPLKQEIRVQAQRLGIDRCLHLLGNRMDPHRLYPAFDVAVLSSLREGFPNSVLEAMAAGVAVVATAVGGLVELIEDGSTGYLVEPADPEALARRIMFAMRDDEGRSAIAERGQGFVAKRFGMPRMVEAFEKLYDELATNRGAVEVTQNPTVGKANRR